MPGKYPIANAEQQKSQNRPGKQLNVGQQNSQNRQTGKQSNVRQQNFQNNSGKQPNVGQQNFQNNSEKQPNVGKQNSLNNQGPSSDSSNSRNKRRKARKRKKSFKPNTDNCATRNWSNAGTGPTKLTNNVMNPKKREHLRRSSSSDSNYDPSKKCHQNIELGRKSNQSNEWSKPPHQDLPDGSGKVELKKSTIRSEITTILYKYNHDYITSKIVRTMLMQKFGCDLTPHKKYIDDTIMELLDVIDNNPINLKSIPGRVFVEGKIVVLAMLSALFMQLTLIASWFICVDNRMLANKFVVLIFLYRNYGTNLIKWAVFISSCHACQLVCSLCLYVYFRLAPIRPLYRLCCVPYPASLAWNVYCDNK